MRSRRCPRPTGRYLEHHTPLRVRFQEVDALHVVWHGHYATYLEEARIDFGRAYGLRYQEIQAAGLYAPVVALTCNYLLPARFDDALDILIRLYRRETAKLEFHYEITRPADAALLAVAQTVQAFAEARDGSLMLTQPPLLRDFYARWEGSFQSSDE